MPRTTAFCTLLLLIASSACAQNWTGAINSDWNNPANWTDWPLDGEDVTIDPASYSGAQSSPVIASASVLSPDRMYVQNGASLSIQASLSVSDRLIVGDDAQIGMTSGTLTTDRLIVELGGAFNLSNGTVNALSVTALGDDGTQPSRFIQDGGTMNANGEFGFDCEAGLSFPLYEMNGGTLNVNGDVIWFGASPGSGRGRIILNAGTAQVNGSLTNTAGSSMDMHVEVHGGTFTTNGPGIDLAHETDSILLSGGAFHFDGNTVIRNDGVFHAEGGDVYFDQAAEMRGVGTYRFNNLTIPVGASLLHTDPAEINVDGDWINIGSFDPDVNTVAFSGANQQTISSTGFFGLHLNNSGNGATLVGPSSVEGELVLDNGIIHTQSNDLLTLFDNATTSGGSASSYVDGPMKKTGNEAFVFPVGKDGQWHRIGISSINDQDTEFTAEYLVGDHIADDLLAPGVIAISDIEYWRLDRAVTNDDPRVELYWPDAAASGIGACSGVSVCHWDNTAWQATPSTVSGACSGNETGSTYSDTSIDHSGAYALGIASNDLAVIPISERTGPRLSFSVAHGSPELVLDGTTENGHLSVRDAQGRSIIGRSMRGQQPVQLADVATGLYTAVWTSAMGRTAIRFVRP